VTHCAAVLNVAGLIANLAGVILLFRYGMPFRVDTGGHSAYVTEVPNGAEIQKDKRYKRIGYLGLGLIIILTAGQIAGALVAN
jgi:hypothetical protein